MQRFKEYKYPDGVFNTVVNIFNKYNSISDTIKEITTIVLGNMEIWKWRLHNSNNYPLVGVYPVKGFGEWKSTRKTHSIVFNGVVNEFILPALCRITIKDFNYINTDKEVLIKHGAYFEDVTEVVGQYSLDTKFVFYNELMDMSDAFEIFDTKDKALDNNKEFQDHKEFLENMKSMNTIFNHFKVLVGGFFKDFFDIEDEKTKDKKNAISTEYADKVYDIFKNAYEIKIKTKDQLKYINYPIITVATKPTTLNYLLDHASNKHLFKDMRSADIITRCMYTIPLILAGMHHTAFREEYMEIKNTIMNIRAKNGESEPIAVENFVQSW